LNIDGLNAHSTVKAKDNMTTTIREKLTIRPLMSGDFDELVHLDSVLLGSEKRRAYWEKKFAVFRLRHPNLSMVATLDNKLVGYIMGNISGWEFGVSAGVGWVELMGVDPDLQRQGVAKVMIQELMHQFKELKTETVFTMIVAHDTHIHDLFKSVGFTTGHMMQLEIDLK
jgi:ribosomal protein S18 acetylase RimI-like enzyme